ncbi:MAG: hypothetical protein LC670_01570 [Flavobacteriales bacterium]|nr:hypothetical protein [Flavobacteriales bacterium]
MIYEGAIPRRGLNALRADGSLFLYASVLTAFFIPLITKGIQIPITLMVVAWAVGPKRPLREVWKPVLVFSGIYLFHLIGMFYTENISRGIADLEQKLSLILFPILLGTGAFPAGKPAGVLPGGRNAVIAAFIGGTVASVVISFAESWSKYSTSGVVNDFYMSEFSPVHHPSYMAMYMNLAAAALLLKVFAGEYSRRAARTAWIVVLFLVLALIFPASKMGLIQVVFLFIFIALFAWRRGQLLSRNGAMLLTTALAFVVFFKTDPIAKQRVVATVAAVSQDRDPTSQIGSNASRIHAWKISAREIKQFFSNRSGPWNTCPSLVFVFTGLPRAACLAQFGLALRLFPHRYGHAPHGGVHAGEAKRGGILCIL